MGLVSSTATVSPVGFLDTAIISLEELDQCIHQIVLGKDRNHKGQQLAGHDRELHSDRNVELVEDLGSVNEVHHNKCEDHVLE